MYQILKRKENDFYVTFTKFNKSYIVSFPNNDWDNFKSLEDAQLELNKAEENCPSFNSGMCCDDDWSSCCDCGGEGCGCSGCYSCNHCEYCRGIT